MKKIAIAFLAALVIGGCGFIPTAAPANPTPTMEVQGTNTPTTAPPTNTVQPTETPAPVTETFTSTPDAPVPNPSITSDLFSSSTQDLTTTPVTATSALITETATAIASGFGTATPSPTLGVLTYGTLPPAVPSENVILANKAKVEVYISLQNQAKNGAILEYPVQGQVTVRAPTGQYIYVAWVGGKKMTGSFNLSKGTPVYLFIFKDKIVVQK